MYVRTYVCMCVCMEYIYIYYYILLYYIIYYIILLYYIILYHIISYYMIDIYILSYIYIMLYYIYYMLYIILYIKYIYIYRYIPAYLFQPPSPPLLGPRSAARSPAPAAGCCWTPPRPEQSLEGSAAPPWRRGPRRAPALILGVALGFGWLFTDDRWF